MKPTRASIVIDVWPVNNAVYIRKDNYFMFVIAHTQSGLLLQGCLENSKHFRQNRLV